MKQPLLTLLIAFGSFLTYGQTPDIDFVHTFEQIEAPKATEELSRTHDFRILGKTEHSLMVEERLKIKVGNEYDNFTFDKNVTVHFLDLKTFEEKHALELFTQKRPKTYWDRLIPPNALVFNKMLYTYKSLSKKEAKLKKHMATTVTRYKDLGDDVETFEKFFQCPKYVYTNFTLHAARDGSCLYVVSSGFLTKKHRKKYDDAVLIMDEDLNQSYYIPTIEHENVYIVDGYMIGLGRGKKITTQGKYGNVFQYKVRLVPFDGSPVQSVILDNQEAISFFGSGIRQIISVEDDKVEFFIGNNCRKCKEHHLALTHLTINLKGTGNNTFKQRDIPYKRVAESKDGDQTDFQEAYFDLLAKVELEQKGVEIEQIMNNRRFEDVCSAKLAYIDDHNMKGVDYILGKPLVLALNFEDSYQAFLLNDQISTASYSNIYPAVFDRDEYEVYLLANFSIPSDPADINTMKDGNPKMLQFLRLDLEDGSVSRINIDGDMENPDENSRYYLRSHMNDGEAFYCISQSYDKEYMLTRIAWPKG